MPYFINKDKQQKRNGLFKWRSKVCVMCVLHIQGGCSTPSSHPSGPEQLLGAPSKDQRSNLPCSNRASGRTARNSFSTWPDLILLRDFKSINNTWFAVSGPSSTPLHQYSSKLKYIMHWTKQPVPSNSSPIPSIQPRSHLNHYWRAFIPGFWSQKSRGRKRVTSLLEKQNTS